MEQMDSFAAGGLTDEEIELVLDHRRARVWAMRPNPDPLDPLGKLRAFQNGRCAVCKERRSTLLVDHDHVTMLVRGLLCEGCNVREGKSAFAPWFRLYRENPPAKLVGLTVKYGSHYRKTQRQTTTAPMPDMVQLLDSMTEAADASPARGPMPRFPSVADDYRECARDLGFAPYPEGVEKMLWRAGLADRFVERRDRELRAVQMVAEEKAQAERWRRVTRLKQPRSNPWDPDFLWLDLACGAYVMIGRALETGEDFLEQYYGV